VVHTGPNAQLGGVQGGFFSLGYHLGIALKVKRLPMPPAAKAARILTTSLTIVLKSMPGSLGCYLFLRYFTRITFSMIPCDHLGQGVGDNKDW